MKKSKLLYCDDGSYIKKSRPKAVLLIIFLLAMGIVFLMAYVRLIPIRPSANYAWVGLLLSAFAFFILFLVIIDELVATSLKIYDDGIAHTTRTIGQIIRNEENFIPFSQIEEFFINQDIQNEEFIARTKKGILEGSKKEEARKIVNRTNGNIKNIAIKLFNGRIEYLWKYKIDNLDRVIELLDDKVKINRSEYFFIE